jgi:hypothetical protein
LKRCKGGIGREINAAKELRLKGGRGKLGRIKNEKSEEEEDKESRFDALNSLGGAKN